MLNLEVNKKENNKITLFVKGEINSANYTKLKKKLAEILDDLISVNEIIIDLKDCEYISSNGFGIFYETKDILEKRNLPVKLRFINVNDIIFENMLVLKMHNEFEINKA